MRRIDEIYTEFPYYGALKITAQLNRELPEPVNHKRIARLMRLMGIQAIFPRKNTSQPHPEHAKYPYLLHGIDINRPNQVWGTDITFVRAKDLWFYLVAIIDWYSRYVVAWKLSKTLCVDFCAEALKQALSTAIPEIHKFRPGQPVHRPRISGIAQAAPGNQNQHGWPRPVLRQHFHRAAVAHGQVRGSLSSRLRVV